MSTDDSNVITVGPDGKRLFPGHDRATLDAGGGGPHPPDMEELLRRVGKLETSFEGVQKDVTEIRISLGKIDGRLSNMPTTFQTLTWFVGIAIALAGFTFSIARTIGTH